MGHEDRHHDNRRVRKLTLIVALLLAPPAHGAGPCPFKLEVKPGKTIILRNAVSGRTAAIDRARRHVWLSASGVPYLSTDRAGNQPRVIDPCALVARSRPPTRPRTTRAPWSLPVFALSQIAYAGLTPVTGRLIRHDHVHLDLIVAGRRVTIPAGIGQVEPVDRGAGPCPPAPESGTIGDCAPGHYVTPAVAFSPLHAHSTSGIIHIESDRPGTFTLGQLFDEWRVRFDSQCVGGYCTGNGKELRVYVDGDRVAGDPRRLVLTDGQEIAVVYGGRDDFGAVPASYAKRMPVGCGGRGERACIS
jgi:hypothetical protein